MIAFFLQSGVFRSTCMLLFVFLLSYHVFADLVVRDNFNIDQFITPRLVAPREEAFPSKNFTFQLQGRGLAQRQNYNCGSGNGYCASNGGCCPSSSGCCGASCTDPGGACCRDGSSCPAGWGCCGALNIGNEGCAPRDGSCCRSFGYCTSGWACCNDGYGCAPVDGECCKDYGYCAKGNRCVTYRGRPSCCPGGICAGGSDNGSVYSSQPPVVGGGVGAPALTEEQSATAAKQTETVKEITSETPPISTQVDEPTSTEEVILIPTPSVPSIGLASFTFTSSPLSLPLITIPTITTIPEITSELEFSITSQPTAPTSSISTASNSDLADGASSTLNALSSAVNFAPTNISPEAGDGQAKSMGMPKIRWTGWLVTGATVFVGVVLVF